MRQCGLDSHLHTAWHWASPRAGPRSGLCHAGCQRRPDLPPQAGPGSGLLPPFPPTSSLSSAPSACFVFLSYCVYPLIYQKIIFWTGQDKKQDWRCRAGNTSPLCLEVSSQGSCV